MTFTAVASNASDTASTIFEFNVTARPTDDPHGVNLTTRAVSRALVLARMRGLTARTVGLPNARPVRIKAVA